MTLIGYKREIKKIINKITAQVVSLKEQTDREGYKKYLESCADLSMKGIEALFTMADIEAEKEKSKEDDNEKIHATADMAEEIIHQYQEAARLVEKIDWEATESLPYHDIKYLQDEVKHDQRRLILSLKEHVSKCKWEGLREKLNEEVYDIKSDDNYYETLKKEYSNLLNDFAITDIVHARDEYGKSMIRDAFEFINENIDVNTNACMTFPRRWLRAKTVRDVYSEILDRYRKEGGDRGCQERFKNTIRMLDEEILMTCSRDRARQYCDIPEIIDQYTAARAPEERVKGYIKQSLEKELIEMEKDNEQIYCSSIINDWFIPEESKSVPLHPCEFPAYYSSEKAAGEGIGIRDALREMGYEEEAITAEYNIIPNMGKGRPQYAAMDRKDNEYAVYTPLMNKFIGNMDDDTAYFYLYKKHIEDAINKEIANKTEHKGLVKTISDFIKEEKAASVTKLKEGDMEEKKEEIIILGALYSGAKAVAYQNELANEALIYQTLQTVYDTFKMLEPESTIFNLMGIEYNTKRIHVDREEMYKETDPKAKEKLSYGIVSKIMDMPSMDKKTFNDAMTDIRDTLVQQTDWARKQEAVQIFSWALHAVEKDCGYIEDIKGKTVESVPGTEGIVAPSSGEIEVPLSGGDLYTEEFAANIKSAVEEDRNRYTTWLGYKKAIECEDPFSDDAAVKYRLRKEEISR